MVKVCKNSSQVGSAIGPFAQLNSIVVSLNHRSRQVKQKARCHTMDKIMNMLGIEMAELHGKDVKPIVHSNSSRRPIGGGKCAWLTPLRKHTLKLNTTIDDI